ncbi:MAG: putative toxin-antitoxin system toxin component, PIN family [Burkholderiales bacterium]|nr:putative toxin-antitoxin system toxin component, PIN family [Burkholderiales bacterium]
MGSDPNGQVRPIVIDTNIVLDLLLFKDPATQALKQALASAKIQWLSTQAMRDELERVLSYPKIMARLAVTELDAPSVLQQFDTRARLVEVAPKASVTCRDADDQKFIDLAVLHKATLLSKDRAVLCMRKRLLTLSVRARTAMDFEP